MTHRIWQRAAVLIAVIVVVPTLALTGCEDTPRDKLTDGKRSLADGNLEEAQRHFEAALKEDDELVEARRLMATTYIESGDFEAAERTLEQLWDDRGFDREGELSADERQVRQLMSEQFSELYRRWAESIDEVEYPERFEEIARTGLERNRRDSALNTMLVDFYEKRADRYVERSQPLLAAEMLERIDDLHRFPDTRRESRERARQLRRQAFGDEAVERFERELRPDLIDADNYDPQRDMIAMDVEQPLDRRLDPDDADAVDRARETAVQTLVPTLSQFAVAMAGLDTDDADTTALQLPELKIEREQFRPGHYEMTVAIERESLVDMAFEYAENIRTYSGADHPEAVNGDQLAVDDLDIRLDTSAIDED